MVLFGISPAGGDGRDGDGRDGDGDGDGGGGGGGSAGGLGGVAERIVLLLHRKRWSLKPPRVSEPPSGELEGVLTAA